ncbi:MAG TPA: MBL fold metallo-hydrolase [Verrucomicrobiae bacterium]
MNKKLSRRDYLKLSGLAVGTLATGGATSRYGGGNPNAPLNSCYPTHFDTQQYTYFNQLKPIIPWGKDMAGNVTGTKLEANEMRITFMGSVVPMARRAQAEMSVFVEVGWITDPDGKNGRPLDQFIFDFGCGVSANYQACGVGYSRMDKIFINHLHGDHVTDLIQVYGFGNGGDRKSPLYIWANGPSGVPNPGMTPPVTDPTKPQPNNYAAIPPVYDDGVQAFCTHLREALRWHTESQAFQGSAYRSYPALEQIAADWGLPYVPAPAGDDPPNDANAMIPIELDWRKTGLDADGRPTGDNIAYNNSVTGAKVLHYPVIHCRKGSMGYKLEWTPKGAAKPLTMMYSSDTKPEWNSILHAINLDEKGNPRGVDVFIHEIAVAPEIWAMKNQGLTQPGDPNDPVWAGTVQGMIDVQNSSHTPQGAFGYMLSEINKVKPPRLAVATHFPTADDTVACALNSVQGHCPEITKVGDQLVWSFDLMVLRVFPDRIEQRRAVVNDFSFNPPIPTSHDDMFAPKYHSDTGAWNAVYQIDRSAEIKSTEEIQAEGGTGTTYRRDGY